MALKSKKVPKVAISVRIEPHVLATLRQGAAYHDIPYQTYLQWLVKEGLKSEAHYYGWSTPLEQYKAKGPTRTQEREIQRLVRMAKRKAKKNAPSTKT